MACKMNFFYVKCAIFISCLMVLDAVKFRCDYTFDNIGWFKYCEMPMAWRDARLQCHLQGAMVASPTTLQIKSIMKNAMGKVDIFTGIHATFSKGHYYSIEGIPLSKMPIVWANSEPDNKNNAERCITMDTDGNLSDVRCDQPRPFICYRPNINKDVNVCGTPDPEYRFESRTNKCYKFHIKPRQFHRAHFACSAEGGHLAIINSEEESKVLQEIFAKYPAHKMSGNFWKDVAYVGFHNWGESQDWTTLHGQSLEDAGFAKWSGGMPDNFTEGEYCGSIFRSGLLNDLWCERHFAFICEKKPDYPPVCDNSASQGFASVPST